MLPVREEGEGGPRIVLLHWLGGSAQSWSSLSLDLSRRGYRVACVDLPGFGDAAARQGCGVEAMAAEVIDTIRQLRQSEAKREPSAWLLGGHSMGGKVAAVTARFAELGEPGLENLAGLVLVSPSPPGPEPMPGNKRDELLAKLGVSTGDGERDRSEARAFLRDNTGQMPLRDAIRGRAELDLLRLNRSAFALWLTQGSREDWCSRVERLQTPALVLAGSEDAALGPEAQQRLLMPHLRSSELVTLHGAGHLAPLERPREIALRMAHFAEQVGLSPAAADVALGSRFQALLDGPLTSPQTRTVMQLRLGAASGSMKPQALERDAFLQLCALVECVVPSAPVNLAARVDERLASEVGDGWRYATLPSDRYAWIKGLHSLDHAALREHRVPFVALWPEQQAALLEEACSGNLRGGLGKALRVGEAAADLYSGAQMKQWFDEVRGELGKLYMSDPRVMERIGFTGFADEAGFTQVRLRQTEEFES